MPEPEFLFFNVIDRNKFKITLEPCTEIENLSDIFLTKEDVVNLTGKSRHSGKAVHYFETEIAETLQKWADTIKPGKASTRIKNSEVKELLATLPTYSWQLTHNLPSGFSVSSKTIYNDALKKERIRKTGRSQKVLQRDIKDLIRLCNRAVRDKYSIDITFHLYPDESFNIILFTKKTCSWKEIKNTRAWGVSNQDLPWIKKIWDEPVLAKQ